MTARSALCIAIFSVIAALSLPSCDEGEEGGDEVVDRGGRADVRAIRRVVRQFVLPGNSKVLCQDVSTRDLVQRIFGDVAQCERAARSQEKGSEPPTGVRTSGVRVAGPTATADVEFVGGDTDGASGFLELRRERGRWRVDDIGEDLLRAMLVTGIESGADGGLLRRPQVRRCVRTKFERLPDDELKRVAYMLLSERRDSRVEAVRLIVSCLRTPDGKSLLRVQFERGITARLRERGAPRPLVDCIVRRLRVDVSERQLAELVTYEGLISPRLTRQFERAVLACRDSRAPPPTTL